MVLLETSNNLVLVNLHFFIESVFRFSFSCIMFKQAAFPAQEKRLDVLNLCSAEIFAYLEENLRLTPQNLSDKALASDELEEMYQQVLHLGESVL